MNEAWAMIHSRAKFLSIYELVKGNTLSASKLQWWGRHRTDMPLPKQRNTKKKGMLVPKQVWKPAGQISVGSKAWENLLWFHALSSGPTGTAALGGGLAASALGSDPPLGTHAVAACFGTDETVAQPPVPLASESWCQWQAHQPLNFPGDHSSFFLKNSTCS